MAQNYGVEHILLRISLKGCLTILLVAGCAVALIALHEVGYVGSKQHRLCQAAYRDRLDHAARLEVIPKPSEEG